MKFIQVLLILGVWGSLNACQHTKKESLSQSIQIDLESEQVQDSLAFSLFVDSMTSIPLETTGEITMIKFDLTMEPKADALWIATYNSQDGGTLQKYYVGNNPDVVELNADPDAVYTGLNKIRNMSWRAKL